MAGYIADAGSVAWCTPERILSVVVRTFQSRIDLDPCSNENSLVNARTSFRLPDVDGLKSDWSNYDNVFVNPPFGTSYLEKATKVAYSNKEFSEKFPDAKQRKDEVSSGRFERQTISDWITKTILVSETVPGILFIPANVDTKIWQNLIFTKCEAVCWVAGRVRFFGGRPELMGKEACAPMAMALVLAGTPKEVPLFRDVASQIGRVTVLQ